MDLETTASTYFPTLNEEGSGDDGKDGGDGKPREEETPSHVVNEQERDQDGGQGGSGSGSIVDLLGSSRSVAMDIGALFLSCVLGLLIQMLMNNS